MLNHRKYCRLSGVFLALIGCCLLLASSGARAQDAGRVGESSVAGFLSTSAVAETEWVTPAGNGAVQRFTFQNQLICFEAVVDDRVGTFILDTGSPRMLVNTYGDTQVGEASNNEGVAAGGQVNLSDEFVSSFKLSGQEFKKVWALGLDLRPLETRLRDSIAGFVGHDLLQNNEVRIDYVRNQFALLPSVRQPQHEGRQPTFTLPFQLVGHLPVITFGRGKQRLRLALDTGASINIMDDTHKDRMSSITAVVDVQGLDGQPLLLNQSRLFTSQSTPLLAQEEFVTMDLSSLQPAANNQRIDGLLGSDFLAKFVVGIDYRRNRLYLWTTPNSTSK